MPKIVQFTHPGTEHGPDKLNGSHKSWNIGNHKRKFIQTNGNYVDGNNLKKGELIFWGEWEPPSNITKLDDKSNKLYPKWLHKPYLPDKIPISSGYKDSYQNTDPCVFGSSFKYFFCKQYKCKPKSEEITSTSLSKLEKGSLILFGSTKGKKPNAFFQLDTVFVVSEYIEYDISDPNALSELNDYRDYVFKMAFPQPLDYSLKLRLYKGATFENKIEGMYSFSPAKLWESQKSGFPRVSLRNMDYITNNLNSSPKISNVSQNQVKDFWLKILNISREKGCVEGVKFNY